MSLDLRIPLGLMLTVTGMVLTFFGAATRTNASVYAASMGIDVNLWWGLVLLAFGFTLYFTGIRRLKRIEQVASSKNRLTGSASQKQKKKS